MTTQTIQKLAPSPKPSALNVMAARLSVDPAKLLETLKATVFQKATNEELLALVTVANEYFLNPFLKEIYAFPAKGGGIVPIVSVDGWNKMLIRQPDFDGIEFEMIDKEDGTPHSCTATVHVKNRAKPMKVTEYFDECRRNTDPWTNMPRRMLRNRTLCQASRMAFGFSGIYHEDEAAAIPVQATVFPAEPPPKLVESSTAAETPLPASESPHAQMTAWLSARGFTFNDLRSWMVDQEAVKDAGSIGTIEEIPEADVKRLMRSPKGLETALNAMKAK